MSKQIIIAEQHRIAAVFSEEQIQELIVAKGSHQVSDIYYGVVENVLPGIDAAFVNIGDTERNGFIHVSDLGPLRLKKTMGAITELLAPQQKVLVQVMKEPTGSKGPRLTGNISLPGRYLVLMPYGRGVNLSRRIRNESERNRLRALAVLIKPSGMGVVIRTEAEGMAEEAIIEDLELLQKQWEAILNEASTTRYPSLLNRDDDFIQRVLRDTFNSDVNRIVVDNHPGLKRVKQHLTTWSSGQLPQGVLVDHHKESIPILDYFRVNAAIREALKPRVDLPSGGYIIIQPTEALTVIDVNSGSFTRSATARETVLWTNYEAATEIARQLRLRNVAGVIIVDFIDMESRRDQLQLLEHFNKALRADKSRPQIAQLTELGLVELTRKRQGQNVYELFGRSCPTCSGLGHLVCLPGQDLNLANLPTAIAVEDSAAGNDFPSDSGISLPDSITGARSRSRLSNGRELRRGRSSSASSPRSGRWSSRSEGGLPALDAETLEPELLNHPSYQDRGSSSNRRRRRSGSNDTTRSLPSEGRDSRDSGSPSGGDWPWPGTPPEGEPSTSSSASSEASTSSPPKRERGRSERSRSRRGSSDSKTEGGLVKSQPKEIINVEMTTDEQEVYAWMGLPPLVLANQEIKNPRNVVVAVSLPGEEPDLSSLSETDYRIRSISSSEDVEETESIADSNRISEEKTEVPPPTVSEAAPKSPEPDTSEPTLAMATTDAKSSSTSEDSPPRRRRRRSSATT